MLIDLKIQLPSLDCCRRPLNHGRNGSANAKLRNTASNWLSRRRSSSRAIYSSPCSRKNNDRPPRRTLRADILDREGTIHKRRRDFAHHQLAVQVDRIDQTSTEPHVKTLN